MHEKENPIATASKRVPWNKGKLNGPRPPYARNMSGPFELGSRSSVRYAIWLFSISPSTANCGVAT